MLLSPQTFVRDPYRVDVKRQGAKGDYSLATGTGTDDRAAIIAAIAAARLLGASVYFPKGNYYLSRYIDIFGDSGLTIRADRGARIYYGSDDTSIGTDAVATSLAMARSAFVLRYCVHTVIENLTFVGGNSPKLNDNQGSGVYARGCFNTTLQNCNAIKGYSLIVQDAVGNVSGTGDSLTVSSGLVTLVDASANFLDGYAGHEIAIGNATNPVNNGVYEIYEVVNSTTVTFRNSNAITETSSFTYTIDTSDSVTRIIGGVSLNCHGSVRGGNNVEISGHTFRLPNNYDIVGQGDYLSFSGGNVTLTDTNAKVNTSHIGKYITIAGATSGANNVLAKITGVTVGATTSTITFANASGVTEAYYGEWWIANGEKTGIGAGATALAKSGTTMTLTSASAAFTADDVNKVVRILNPTSNGNRGVYAVTAVLSSTQIQYENSAGVAETFDKQWTLDSHDRTGGSSDAYGSSHAIYVFAGRSNYRIHHCTFENIRETAVKVSGSSIQINDIFVDHCEFVECGNVITWGADDSQQHNNLSFVDNTVVDCGTGRQGWHGGVALGILGARNVIIARNKFYYSRNAVGSVDGRGVAGNQVISASRYQAGRSQPIEYVEVTDNVMSADPSNTDGTGKLMPTVCLFTQVGHKSHYRTGGTLTKSGDIMTLTDSQMIASTQWVGRTIDLVNSASGNDGSFTIESVPNGTTLTFTNAAGTGGGVSAGTYRIWPGKKASTYGNSPNIGGSLRFMRNTIANIAPVAFSSNSCIAPEVAQNTIAVGSIQFLGDLAPKVWGNRQIANNTGSATLRLDSGTSWPVVYDNVNANANGMNSNISGRSWVIGVDNGTARDYPLLGKSGRVRPTNAFEEIVVAYGSQHVDGDTLEVNGTTYTYKASAPTGNQFNTFAGLVALIDAQAGFDCADYGTGFSSGSVTTQHMRIRRTTQSTSDGTVYVRAITLNPTALVILRNNHTSSPFCKSRGSGSAGPIGDKTVVWSQCANWECPIQLIPDNSVAKSLLFDGSPAEGKITCVAKASLVDTDYITIGDGVTPAKLYEFDTAGDGVTAGRIQVDISTDTTAAQVAARLKTAIEANQPLFTVTDNADGTLTITHKIPGVVGNSTITENVANAGFLVVGLSNGLAGGYLKLGNQEDTGACAVMQHAKSSNQAGTDLGAEFRFYIG